MAEGSNESHQEITIHSGNIISQSEKSYHSYVSDDRKQDKIFVHICLEKMLSDLEIPENSYTVIESDYYNSQYKSAVHFHSIQQLCNKLNVTIIHVNGIAEHSKEEVEHVGGLAKVAVRKAVAQGEFFADSTDAVSYLNEQLKDKENLTYVVRKILEEDLSILRPES